MQAYPLAMRERVLADCDAGLKTKAVAEKYHVSRTWVRSLKQRRRETGEIAPRRGGGGRKRKFDRARLAELVAADADATLAELRERLGVKCALSAIWMALDQLHITFKKNAASGRARPTRCRRAARGVACHATRTRPRAARFRRRNVVEDEHDAALRPGASRRARGGESATRPLENDHAHRGARLPRDPLRPDPGRPRGWRGL